MVPKHAAIYSVMQTRPIVAADPGRFELVAHHSPAREYAEETHETVQVCVPLERARYRVVRQSETGRGLVHDLGARDVLVIPAGQPHAVTWKRPADIVMLHLSEAFLATVLDVGCVRVGDAFTLRDPFISAAAAEVRAALGAGGRINPVFADAVATAIAYRIGVGGFERRIRGGDAVLPLSSGQQARLERFIDDRLNAPIRLSDLAEVVGLSVWHFMRRFAASYGVTPHNFITERRVGRARALLSTSRLPIAAIALDVGMSHSHFSRTFLARVGVSPQEFRRLRG
jgi:AraC family transcriptional regulator